MTKKELQQALTDKGVKFNKKATNKQLEDLLASLPDSPDETINQVFPDEEIKDDEAVVTGMDLGKEVIKPKVKYLSSIQHEGSLFTFKVFDKNRKFIEKLEFTSADKAVIEFNRLSK